MTKLLPCPFCGGAAELIESAPATLFSDEGETVHFKVQCKGFRYGCIGAHINLWDYSQERAIKAWNTRKEVAE